MDSFLGEVRVFGFNFAPQDWAYCNGQVLGVQQSQALFAVIGNIYGGSQAQQTFALPNLCGRAPMGAGSGPGLTQRAVGAAAGGESVALTPAQNASHNHTLNAQNPTDPTVMSTIDSVPTATHWLSRVVHTNPAPPVTVLKAFSTGTPNTQLPAAAIGASGGGQPHDNRQPSLAMNFCISMAGEFPMRPS